PSWGLVVVVGLGALLLGLVVGVAWSTWDLEARITQTLTDSLHQQAQPPQPSVPHPRQRPRQAPTPHGLCRRTTSGPYALKGLALFRVWLRRRGRDPWLGISSQHCGSYRAAARLAVSLHVTGRGFVRPVTCKEIDVQGPEQCPVPGATFPTSASFGQVDPIRWKKITTQTGSHQEDPSIVFGKVVRTPHGAVRHGGACRGARGQPEGSPLGPGALSPR